MSSLLAVFINYLFIGSILSFCNSPIICLYITVIGTFFFYFEKEALLVVIVYLIFAFSSLIQSKQLESILLTVVAVIILICNFSIPYIPDRWKLIQATETKDTNPPTPAIPYRGFVGTKHTIRYFSHVDHTEAAIRDLLATGFSLKQISLIYKGDLPQRKPFTTLTISAHFDAMRLSLSDARARFYHKRIKQGDYVIIVSCINSDINRAASILSRYGIQNRAKLLSFVITISSIGLALAISLSKLSYWQENHLLKYYFGFFISFCFSVILSICSAIFIDKSTNYLSRINIDFFEESFNDSQFVNSLVVKIIVISTCSLGLLLGWKF
ncbi:hypothetical protein WKK05_30405 [Nostoc sp. UHCC 0302]|uniref:hypothetical protein n=1 Tax=Nostoc sp. UHCC 0302 TaxID=3134896 RepID=UPI00311CD28F